MLVVVTLALGFGYPLVVTGISQVFFHHQANGSLVCNHGKLVGSAPSAASRMRPLRGLGLVG